MKQNKQKQEWKVYETFSSKHNKKELWNNKALDRLRKILYSKFEHYENQEWESYKELNKIEESKPKKVEISWKNAFYYEGINEQNGINGKTTLELEFYDEQNKVVVIKDPFTGVGWEPGEPTEGSSWISIPEKLAEKLLMMESFKN